VPCNDHRTVFASPLSAVFIVGVYKLKRESAIGSVCANLSSLKASVEQALQWCTVCRPMLMASGVY